MMRVFGFLAIVVKIDFKLVMKVHFLLFSRLVINLTSRSDLLVCIANESVFCIMLKVDSSLQGVTTQDSLLETVLATLISGDDAVPGHAFLEANSSHESCLRLLEMWNL